MSYSLSLLLPDLGLSGFLHLFLSSIPLSSLGCLPQRELLFPISVLPLLLLKSVFPLCGVYSFSSNPYVFSLSPTTFSPVLPCPCGWSLLLSFLFFTLAFSCMGFTSPILPLFIHLLSTTNYLHFSQFSQFWGEAQLALVWTSVGTQRQVVKMVRSLISPAPNDFVLPSFQRTTYSCPHLCKSMVMAAHLAVKVLPV